jgi:PLP dependent protein
MSICENINSIKEQIIKTSLNSGRNPEDITLLGISKRFSVEKIVEASKCGINSFGENYGQEFRDKYDALKSLNLIWHFTGPLQSNKIKYVVGKTSLIHTVSSEKVLKAIENKANQMELVQNVLVQIHTGDETSKSGIKPDEIKDFLLKFENTPHVKCVGLMTLPPFDLDHEIVRPYFRQLREIKEEMSCFKIRNVDLKHLSMGMTADYTIAIEEGATIIRIGTAIFGERTPQPAALIPENKF